MKKGRGPVAQVNSLGGIYAATHPEKKRKRTPLVDPNELIVAVDPGNMKSAYVVMDRQRKIVTHGKIENMLLRALLTDLSDHSAVSRMVIESPRPRGQQVTWQLFQTCQWIGRFIEAWHPKPYIEADRRKVKYHLTESVKSTDAQVRAALMGMWGGKDIAVGSKKSGHLGPLYGMKADIWQALAVGVTFVENGL